MSLRLRLLLLSSITLLLPWAGYQYARQMEEVLRNGQERAVLTTAQLLADVIATDSDLIEQSLPPPSNEPTLFAAQLSSYPLLDGFADEWPQPSRPLPNANNDLRLGIFSGALYAFVHVADAHVRYEEPGDNDRPIKNTGDRILVMTRDESGVERAWSLSAVAPGPVIVRRANTTAPWKATNAEENEIRGVWRATADGFDVELRMPLRFVGAHFAIVHIDDEIPPPEFELASLRTASESLRDRLALYAPEGLRVSVVDAQGWLLARVGTLKDITTDDDAQEFYRWLVGRSEQVAPAYGLPYGMWGPPIDAARVGKSNAIWFQPSSGEPSTVRAAIPIKSNNVIVGALAAEQTGSQLLHDRDAALAKLLRLTLLVTVFVVGAAFIFAAWLSRRIRRLSVAATNALSPKGDLNARLPEVDAYDELGDLARNYATLLQRVKEYTQYLQTLGSKLSHEFRTPLTIVSSSLENLAVEKGDRSHEYIQRARDGAARLHAILTAMTEATRVEQSIETAERVQFDLADLLRGVGQAYAQTFNTHRIEVTLPSDACPIYGAPELIVQMLDKLIDNAVDFCPHGQNISIELVATGAEYILSVTNDGPLLAPEAENNLFDMLVSSRNAESDKPHLGLGLFIVQLIARFHGGRASARNLPNLAGVCVEVRLARV